ncbi:olfactory receptor 9I1-like [Ambystoma mexicanum]|uniref:olfactory receptor 9I1-like n=1 Tax=Ambystoma mexicanum TaxID=8296 RepID=UPI0037E7A89B
MSKPYSSTWRNQTLVTEFIFLGFTDDPYLQILLFVLFLPVYLITLLGNVSISILIKTAPSLHTPMYLFIVNLSCMDLCYSSIVTPKMLVTFLCSKKVIYLTSCAAQLFFYSIFSTSECLLLAVMAYDRHVAICNPLRYSVVMNGRTCAELLLGTYTGGVLTAIVITTCTFSLAYCESNEINHYFCDLPPLMKLSCSDTSTNEMIIFIFAFCLGGGSLTVILISYGYIISAILKICTTTGRQRAFSTCTSHLTVVALFYGSLLFMYLKTAWSPSGTQDKVVSLIYTAAIPMLNPMIYTLRNQDVKQALSKLIKNM